MKINLDDDLWEVPEELEAAMEEVLKKVGGVEKLNEMKVGEVFEMLQEYVNPSGDHQGDSSSEESDRK